MNHVIAGYEYGATVTEDPESCRVIVNVPRRRSQEYGRGGEEEIPVLGDTASAKTK